jgi:predicted transposase YdaD
MEEVIAVESPFIAKLLAGAETKGKGEGKREGKLEGKIETLLRLVQKSFQELPEEVASGIRGCKDSGQLDRWLDAVVETENLAEFRRQTGL